ncbi:MAG: biotin--[acetyl-CoA-carboxylase] ligase [Bacteroides sp.]|nr:biotin--[acetyl-CoA-carboxylase] ligase [Bacteroides sp.]
MNILILDETASTNSYVAEHEDHLTAPVMVAARRQYAGRGQRGNSWESEPGKNLTASVLLRPDRVLPRQQFAISEAIALAVVATLAQYGIEARVKWPNDIYVADGKICGILIEHSLMGHQIRRTIAGFGLNINQTEFISDAPNPISMSRITGVAYDAEEVARRTGENIERYLPLLPSEEGRGRLHELYMATLWRGEGEWPFLDNKTGETLSASIHGIAPDGTLTLKTHDGELRPYAFKEVSFLPIH